MILKSPDTCERCIYGRDAKCVSVRKTPCSPSMCPMAKENGKCLCDEIKSQTACPYFEEAKDNAAD